MIIVLPFYLLRGVRLVIRAAVTVDEGWPKDEGRRSQLDTTWKCAILILRKALLVV